MATRQIGTMADEPSPNQPVPPWADADLSRCLPTLAAGGERQDMEFKERFPGQARDLAKEIAAFATSNFGTILLGVSKAGGVIGLADCESASERERLLDRVAGICANSIKPSVTPALAFAVVEDRTVLAIAVPKGDAPLYYVAGVPYLRQMATSRPAEPHEVIDRVLDWDRARNGSGRPSPESEFLSQTASLVVDVVVYADELEERRVKPWLNETRHGLAWAAETARDLAARTPGDFAEMVEPLEEMASNLDRAAHERLSMGGGWDEMDAAARAARETARSIWTRWIEPHGFHADSVAGVRETVSENARKLASLAARLQEMDDQGRLDGIQSSAGEIGLVLLKAATFGVGLGDDQRIEELTAIGRALRDVETRTIYADGGQSARRILDDVRDASARLNAWLAGLPSEAEAGA
ncbi:ATP-binding protein [Thalassospira profundimaris]|jgi:ATP-dependent DNA helicase RecG|nr:aaa-4 family protein [Thalassospira profundimaris WP0211]